MNNVLALDTSEGCVRNYWMGCGLQALYILTHAVIHVIDMYLILEGISLKKLREGIGPGGGGQSDPFPLLLTPFIRLTRYLAHTISVVCTFN